MQSLVVILGAAWLLADPVQVPHAVHGDHVERDDSGPEVFARRPQDPVSRE